MEESIRNRLIETENRLTGARRRSGGLGEKSEGIEKSRLVDME